MTAARAGLSSTSSLPIKGSTPNSVLLMWLTPSLLSGDQKFQHNAVELSSNLSCPRVNFIPSQVTKVTADVLLNPFCVFYFALPLPKLELKQKLSCSESPTCSSPTRCYPNGSHTLQLRTPYPLPLRLVIVYPSMPDRSRRINPSPTPEPYVGSSPPY